MSGVPYLPMDVFLFVFLLWNKKKMKSYLLFLKSFFLAFLSLYLTQF